MYIRDMTGGFEREKFLRILLSDPSTRLRYHSQKRVSFPDVLVEAVGVSSLHPVALVYCSGEDGVGMITQCAA